ncbi:MAG: N-acetyltransferase family protein [Proteobacteria bacterium]|nr:N-acetyltransferase family protein [Pseudomonadota bacterium]
MIRAVSNKDFEQLWHIYCFYVKTSIATFDTETPSFTNYSKKLSGIQQNHPVLVSCRGGEILGFAYAGKWRDKKGYDQTAETTIYLKQGQVGAGLGLGLYQALLTKLQAQGITAIIGGMSVPNHASVALHRKLGFKKVAYFEKVGRKFDQNIDVEYWQKLFES